jgi:hypothetical protein
VSPKFCLKKGPPERAQKRLKAGIARVPVTALATALAISLRGRQAIMPLANSNGIETDFGKLRQFDWFDAESPFSVDYDKPSFEVYLFNHVHSQ